MLGNSVSISFKTELNLLLTSIEADADIQSIAKKMNSTNQSSHEYCTRIDILEIPFLPFEALFWLQLLADNVLLLNLSY